MYLYYAFEHSLPPARSHAARTDVVPVFGCKRARSIHKPMIESRVEGFDGLSHRGLTSLHCERTLVRREPDSSLWETASSLSHLLAFLGECVVRLDGAPVVTQKLFQ